MIAVTETTSVPRTPEAVFAFVTDGRNRPRWDSTVVSEELTSPPPLAAGSTIRTVLRVMGREVEIDWRVEEYEPPRRIRIVSTSGPLPSTVTFDVVPAGDGSTLSATIESTPTGMLRFVEPMIGESVRSNLAGSVARIAPAMAGD